MWSKAAQVDVHSSDVDFNTPSCSVIKDPGSMYDPFNTSEADWFFSQYKAPYLVVFFQQQEKYDLHMLHAVWTMGKILMAYQSSKSQSASGLVKSYT